MKKLLIHLFVLAARLSVILLLVSLTIQTNFSIIHNKIDKNNVSKDKVTSTNQVCYEVIDLPPLKGN